MLTAIMRSVTVDVNQTATPPVTRNMYITNKQQKFAKTKCLTVLRMGAAGCIFAFGLPQRCGYRQALQLCAGSQRLVEPTLLKIQNTKIMSKYWKRYFVGRYLRHLVFDYCNNIRPAVTRVSTILGDLLCVNLIYISPVKTFFFWKSEMR